MGKMGENEENLSENEENLGENERKMGIQAKNHIKREQISLLSSFLGVAKGRVPLGGIKSSFFNRYCGTAAFCDSYCNSFGNSGTII